MQIMINIPDAIKEMADEDDKKLIHMMWMFILIDAIKNGIVLPKGHGRLIDADVLCDYFWDNRSKIYTHKDLRIVIDNALTIIEADKEEGE